MSPTLTCLALALVGANLGYQPAPNGGTEFIIQINPATLKTLQPGDPIECDVPREAQGLRPTHFSITTGNDPLPHVVSNPAAASAAPATAPIVTASPVMPAVANSTTPPSAFAPGGGVPIREPWGVTGRAADPSAALPPGGGTAGASPPASYPPPRSTVAHLGPLLRGSSSAESRFRGLSPIGPDGGSSGQLDRPWLGMCLLVIALLASNTYVGWLFWDARQRYRGLLARSFSLGQPAAEA
jgi:hypothetical protein